MKNLKMFTQVKFWKKIGIDEFKKKIFYGNYNSFNFLKILEAFKIAWNNPILHFPFYHFRVVSVGIF